MSLIFCNINALAMGGGGSSKSSVTLPDVRSRLQNALQLSKLSSSNITSAHLACREWKSIFDDDSNLKDFNQGIIGLCYALYGSCLVRIGQDDEALAVFESALQFKHVLDIPTFQKVILGKAQALQRCFKYEEAFECYRKGNSDQAVIGAATCALRLRRLKSAKEAIQEFCGDKDNSTICPEIRGMMATLDYISSGSLDSLKAFLKSSASMPPLYRWICNVLLKRSPEFDNTTPTSKNPFLNLIAINLCAFDDPNLKLLDDKIRLHDLLSSRKEITNRFWPEGYTIASSNNTQLKRIREDEPESLWISKLRFGYGSHGNTIFKLKDEKIEAMIEKEEDSILFQRMVEPMLLLDGYKFSLRIYFVYFRPGKAYISKAGLVKLASTRAAANQDNSIDPRVHMTNSGRESSMQQRDLQYLSSALKKSGHSYDDFWHRIKSVVKDSLTVFHQNQNVENAQVSECEERRRQLGIPKILGFDFVVDEFCRPWLVEVNRFPGLEPRDDIDRKVKHKVVRDAWLLAGEVSPIVMNPLESWIDNISCEEGSSCLEKIRK